MTDLVKHYQSKQLQNRTKGTKGEVKKSPDLFCVRRTVCIICITFMYMLQLNFAKYERSGRFGYKMVPPGKIQVPGFANSDTYQEVTAKGARGLGLRTSSERLHLIVSNGLIRDAPLPSGLPWTLGNYVNEFGGVQARGKRTFGIYMPYDVVDEEDNYNEGEENVRTSRMNSTSGTPVCYFSIVLITLYIYLVSPFQ